MRLVLHSVSHIGLHLVVDATRLPRVPRGGLERHTGGTVRGQLEEEGIGVLATQLFDQSLLESGEGSLVRLVSLQGGEDLTGGEVEVLPEGKTQHIKVLPPIPEGCKYMAVHLSVFQVLRFHKHHPIDGVDMCDMVDEVPFAEVNGDLAVG